LTQYSSVQLRKAEVSHAEKTPGGFLAFLKHEQHRCRKLLIATGLFDELPPVEGIASFFGTSVFQCPYCDGWEARDQPIAVYGKQRRGFEMARAMTAWSRDLVLCTDGPAGLSAAQCSALKRRHIRVIESPIARLLGTRGALEAIAFRNGEVTPRTALFFDTPSHPQSPLSQILGCEVMRDGGIRCGKYAESSVSGIFLAGNITRDVQLAIVAAAEGAKAAFGINRALTREDFRAPYPG
jgi:thioredoxin reductase